MIIVDSHVHVGLTKYVPVEVLSTQMQVAGVHKALLVQYGGCYDNAYLGRCIEHYPGRFAALGAVDVTAPDAPARIRREVSDHHLSGLRISAAVDRREIWEVLDDLGLMASLTGGLEEFVSPRMEQRIGRYPSITFRIEHLGAFPDADGTPEDPLFSRLMEYAAFPNVVLALSGFYAFGKTYPIRKRFPL